jgi:hypothetical protein
MREFESPDASYEVNRPVVEAFLAAFGAYKSRGEKVACRHFGIESLGADASAYYRLQHHLDAMKELQEQFGNAFMRKVGAQIFDNAVFPPGIDSVEKGLAMVNVAYYMNHRNVPEGGIGGYHWTAETEHRGVMVCDNPYPCAFDLGILETIAKRFAPAAKVTHEAGSCRHEGGLACRYVVEW